MKNTNSDKINILITSISAKIPLINKVKDAKNKFNTNIIIYGADLNETCIGKYFVDIFYKMSPLDSLNLNDFFSFCKQKKIKYIIPTRDGDVDFFSKIKNELKKQDIYLLSPDQEAVKFCYDKLFFYNYGQESFLIPTSNDIKKIIADRFVVKEQFGNGSKGIAINVSKKEALKFAKTLKHPIFQPFIKGKEFSVDSYVTQKGNCIGSIVRSRDIINNGESQVTTYVIDEILSQLIKNFVEKFHIVGHSVVQVIKNKNNYYIVECNARFGGASTLSYTMGLESFYWFLQELNDQEINFKLHDKKLKQIRFAEDKYIEC